MKGEDAPLTHWHSDLEEYQFTILHWPGKLQGHVDGLSRLFPPQLVALITDSVEMEQKVMDLAKSTLDNPSIKNTVVDGRAYDNKGRLLLGPRGTAHAIEVLHHVAVGHVGV